MTHMGEPPEQPEPTLRALSRMTASDVLLTIYFAGAVLASGVIGVVNSGELGAHLDGLSALVYSWGMILIGVSGLIARVSDSRQGEFYAIIGVSILTIVNGVLLLPDHPQTALRLGFAPCMMVPYGWMRMGYVIPKARLNCALRLPKRR